MFKQYYVLVGFSLDGNNTVNDFHRVFYQWERNSDMIMEKLSLCREHGLSIGCIVVGGKKHIVHILELYNFLSESNLNFKFNPIFLAGKAVNNADKYSVTMAIELFDCGFTIKNIELQNLNLYGLQVIL